MGTDRSQRERNLGNRVDVPTAVKTVDRSRLFSAKEDKVGSISRKAHGIGVLGC